MKGKRGPKPQDRKKASRKPKTQPKPAAAEEPLARECEAHHTTVIEGTMCPQCAAELGQTAVVDKPNGHAKPIPQLECDDCTYKTPNLDEMTEHLSGTGHTGYESVEIDLEEQAELFSGDRVVTRSLRVPITAEELGALHKQAADISMRLVEEEEQLQMAKARIKAFTADRNKLVAALRDPYKNADVAAEWRVYIEENAKKLHRLDNEEVIEMRPLSAEDREQYQAQANADNNQQQRAVA